MTCVPVVLADIEGFFAAIFFVIAFIGWIANLVNQQQAGNKRQQRPAAGRPRREQVQQEIDRFLNQNRGPNRREPQQTAPARGNIPEDEIEVVQPGRARPQKREPPEQQRKSRRQIWEEQVGRQKQKTQKQTQPPRRRPRKGVAEAAVTPTPETKEQRKEPRPSLFTEPPAASTAAIEPVKRGDQTPPGEGTLREAAATAPRRTSMLAAEFLKRIRTQNGARDAIIMNEILSKPLALRDRS